MITRRRGMSARPVRRYRGMGQDSTDTLDTSGLLDVSAVPVTPPSGADLGLISTSVPSETVSPGFFQSLAGSLQGIVPAAGAAANLYRSFQTPSLVAGTQAIYNPATGQFYNPQTGQVVNPTPSGPLGTATTISTAFAGMGPLLLIGGLALGGILLVSAMK